MPASTTTATAQTRLGPSFTLLWSGEGVSLLGTAATSVLLPLLAVTHFHAGPAWMGMLTAATWLPWLLIGLPAGAWLDRLDPRVVMITADLVSAATLASVPLGWGLGFLTLPQLLVVALLSGGATVFFRTAHVKLLPLIVPEERLETANARLFGTESAMQIAGPGLAGLLAQLASAAVGIVSNAVGFCVSAFGLWRIRIDRSSEPDPGLVEPLPARIAEGIRAVLRDPHLRSTMVIGGVSNFGLTGYTALLVLFLIDNLRLSPGQLWRSHRSAGRARAQPPDRYRPGLHRAVSGRRAQRAARRGTRRRPPRLPHLAGAATGWRGRCRRQRNPRRLAPTLRTRAPDGTGIDHDAGGQLRHHATRRPGGRSARQPARRPTCDPAARRGSRPGLYKHPFYSVRPWSDIACTA
jgi:Major Facilitator Superfamily